ncbi:sigma 54-interacting transcriptional regulator, partial [Clostridioides difficile]
NNGTIFLDEIGEMDLNSQSKLLRVIQEKQVRRIGSNNVIDIDVRIIAATNRNLKELVSKN